MYFDMPDPHHLWLLRFIDDLFVVHHDSLSPGVLATLSSIHPPYLTFELVAVGVRGHVLFLDIYAISLAPLVHCVSCEMAASCNHIPFHSDVPIRIKKIWIFGCVRYLQLNNHHAFYSLCLHRLRLAPMRFGYPELWYSPFLLP